MDPLKVFVPQTPHCKIYRQCYETKTHPTIIEKCVGIPTHRNKPWLKEVNATQQDNGDSSAA